MSDKHHKVWCLSNDYHGSKPCNCGPSELSPAHGSPFRALTLQGLKTLIQRLDDANASVLTTMETATHAGENELAGKLSLTNTTINAITERYKVALERMENS